MAGNSSTPPEHKAEKARIERRLSSDPRWEEAKAFKLECYNACIKAKMDPGLASLHSWLETDKAFPPLAESASVPVVRGVARSMKKAGVSAPEMAAPENPLAIPESWGALPEKAPFRSEVEWVYQNFSLIVERTTSGADRLRLDRALSPAPSTGTIGLAENAMNYRKSFFESVVPKVLGGLDGEGGETTVRERRGIEEIRGVLAQLKERRV
jgi:hypothetical protein